MRYGGKRVRVRAREKAKERKEKGIRAREKVKKRNDKEGNKERNEEIQSKEGVTGKGTEEG